MSQNNITQRIESWIPGAMSTRLRKSDFKEPFYLHLDRLVGFKLVTSQVTAAQSPQAGVSEISYKSYLGLEENALAVAAIVEKEAPSEIDWRAIDNFKDRFHEALRAVLGTENYRSEFMKPLIQFSIDRLEQGMVYEYAYPGSPYNPWQATSSVFQHGILLMATDDRSLILEYDDKAFIHVDQDEVTSLGIVGNNNNNKERCTTLIVDRRHGIQALVHEYLIQEAPSAKNAKTVTAIRDHLVNHGRKIADQQLKVNVLLPLKREGLIGSNSSGYFHISTEDDLLIAFNHSKSAIEGMLTTLKLYRKRAEALGFDLSKFEY